MHLSAKRTYDKRIQRLLCRNEIALWNDFEQLCYCIGCNECRDLINQLGKAEINALQGELKKANEKERVHNV